MAEEGQYAYVTGGASGIGKAITEMLLAKGAKVFIADRDISAANALVTSLNKNKNENVAYAVEVDVTSWEQQLAAFEKAVSEFGRIDYVFPIAGIGERRWMPNDPKATEFVKPDLTVLDVDLTGVLWTVSLAIQQFRRQEIGKFGFRGKMINHHTVASSNFNSAITGFVRSYGKYLPEEQITMNSVNPNVIRTQISSGAFYDSVKSKGLLTPMEGLLDAVKTWLGHSQVSGEVFEISPVGGYSVRAAPKYLDEQSREVCELLHQRSHVLHEAW